MCDFITRIKYIALTPFILSLLNVSQCAVVCLFITLEEVTIVSGVCHGNKKCIYILFDVSQCIIIQLLGWQSSI